MMLAFQPKDTRLASEIPIFTFEVAASLLNGAPHLQITGQPSNVVVVTQAAAALQLNLANSLPAGWSADFDTEDPLYWHDFCGVSIAQPTWITGPTTTANQMSLTGANPVTPAVNGIPSPPIIVGFQPFVVFMDPEGNITKHAAPDPTIINVDPVGG
jgi:hypothetical protein